MGWAEILAEAAKKKQEQDQANASSGSGVTPEQAAASAAASDGSWQGIVSSIANRPAAQAFINGSLNPNASENLTGLSANPFDRVFGATRGDANSFIRGMATGGGGSSPYLGGVADPSNVLNRTGALGAEINKQLGGRIGPSREESEAAQRNAIGAMGARYGGIGSTGYKDQNQARAQQMALIRQLQDQAAGIGPSLAQAQLQGANEAAMRQAMALGYSQRGAGAGGALKSIREQQAGLTQQNAADSAMLRMQEQLAARQMLGGLIGGMRGQDQSNMQFGLSGQSTLAMQQAAFEEARRQANEQNRLAWEQARQGQAGIDYQNSFMGNFSKILGGAAQIGGMLGGGLEAYGQMHK